VISLSLASTVVLLLADGGGASTSGEPATWVSVVKIVVGVLLVLFALRQWGGRGDAEDEAPAWMRKLDNVTVAKAFGLATLFNVVKRRTYCSRSEPASPWPRSARTPPARRSALPHS
jgi:hypothetical protein